MSKTDHLAKARDYIAIAESGDSKREAYAKAGAEIEAWLAEDESRTQADAARRLGTNRMAVTRALQAHRTGELDFRSGSNKRDDVVAKALADEAKATAAVAALPTETVERVLHAAANELTQRQRPVRQATPAHRSLFQRFADHCFTGWKLQDEVQDTPPPTGAELARFRAVAEANLAFDQAIVEWLDTGAFDEDIARLLAEVQGS